MLGELAVLPLRLVVDLHGRHVCRAHAVRLALCGVGGRSGREDEGAREGQQEDARSHGAEATAKSVRGIGGSPSRALAPHGPGKHSGSETSCPASGSGSGSGGAPMPRGPGCDRIRSPTHPPRKAASQMFTPRRTLASLLVVGASASRPAVATPTPRRSSRTPRSSRTRAVSCRRTRRRPPGGPGRTKSAEEAAEEIQAGAEELQENATDAASDAIESAGQRQRAGRGPKALEQAHRTSRT